MCEINPKRTRIFRIEFFTSSSKMTDERWNELLHSAMVELVVLEHKLNETGEIRVHVHDQTAEEN